MDEPQDRSVKEFIKKYFSMSDIVFNQNNSQLYSYFFKFSIKDRVNNLVLKYLLYYYPSPYFSNSSTTYLIK